MWIILLPYGKVHCKIFLKMKISNCCGAPVSLLGEEFGICPECMEPCEFEEEVEFEEEGGKA